MSCSGEAVLFLWCSFVLLLLPCSTLVRSCSSLSGLGNFVRVYFPAILLSLWYVYLDTCLSVLFCLGLFSVVQTRSFIRVWEFCKAFYANPSTPVPGYPTSVMQPPKLTAGNTCCQVLPRWQLTSIKHVVLLFHHLCIGSASHRAITCQGQVSSFLSSITYVACYLSVIVCSEENFDCYWSKSDFCHTKNQCHAV